MMSSLLREIVKEARCAAERKLARKRESRAIVDADGWTRIPVRRRLGGLGEEVKCVVWGVSEKKFTEADVKRLCLEMGMDVTVSVVRVGRDNGRRVEIICSSEEKRDKCVEILNSVFRERYGWRIVKGRSFIVREEARRERGGGYESGYCIIKLL